MGLSKESFDIGEGNLLSWCASRRAKVFQKQCNKASCYNRDEKRRCVWKVIAMENGESFSKEYPSLTEEANAATCVKLQTWTSFFGHLRSLLTRVLLIGLNIWRRSMPINSGSTSGPDFICKLEENIFNGRTRELVQLVATYISENA